MSFTSVLPTPQIILKAKPAPPTDTAKGIDTLVSLTVYAAPKDTAKGVEALSAFSVSIPPQLDAAKAIDRPALAGSSLYGYILRMVRGTDLARGIRGDIILPDDQNNLVYAWRAKIDKLSEIETRLRETSPSLADTLAAYIGELKSVVDSMPIVKEGDWVYSEHFNLHLRALRKLIEIEEWLTAEVSCSASGVVQLLDAMKSYAGQLSEKRAGDIVASADWNNLKQALGVAPRLNELASDFARPTIYLFNVNDWATARQYVDDYSIVPCWYNIPTLPADEVRELVRTKRVVFVILIDTQPYYVVPVPAWYPVFYTVQAPWECGVDYDYVIDPDFRKFLGETAGSASDYCIGMGLKVSGVKNYTAPFGGGTCGWGYKRYERGAVMETPWDGFWRTPDKLKGFIDAISNILLGACKPARILYLASYTGDPDVHPLCFPIDNCFKKLAEERGWKIIDLRG